MNLEKDFLPKDYSIPASTSYMKFENGDNKFRALGSVVTGYIYWTNENKPVRSKDFPKDTPNIQLDEKGNTKPVNYFWVFPVWDYKQKKVSLLEITQKTVMRGIEGLLHDEDWGNPMNYDINVKKEGSGLTTKYSIVPANKKQLSQDIVDAYASAEITLDDIFTPEKEEENEKEAF